MRSLFFAMGVLVCCQFSIGAQDQMGTVRVQVRAAQKPIEDAVVTVAGASHRTDVSGTTIVVAAAGNVDITVVKPGFAPATTSVQVGAGATQEVIVELQPQPSLEESVTVVASTRTDKRLEDQPMRVEVLAREEIEEKMLMTPGDIVMMLNEMGGMRVQTTSPSLGAASVRIQGMRGRYTRVLSDGLPLFGEVGGLGLLQIPPMDLGQVEVIKGVASALYGAGAMGGVINLLSRRPGAEPEEEFLLNRSTRGATDAVTFLSRPFTRGWSGSLLGGGHWQETNDVNDDAWADLPGYARGVVRPRVFWDGGGGRTFFATTGFTYEDRNGGTPDGDVLVATGQPYVEALETRRYDAGALGQFLFKGRYVVTARAAVARQSHDHQFGEVLERDRHDTRVRRSGRPWRPRAVRRGSRDSPSNATHMRRAMCLGSITPSPCRAHSRSMTSPRQHTCRSRQVLVWMSIASTARSSVLAYRRWRTPVAGRAGSRSEPVSSGPRRSPKKPKPPASRVSKSASLFEAERGLSASFDLSRTDGPLSYTATLFASRINDPLHVERSPSYVLSTLPDPTTNVGLELLGTLRKEPFSVTATYTYVQARETVSAIEQDVPLTPRHSAGIVGMWEAEDVGRLGIEWYYTGRQSLEENPYRTVSEPYMILGLLAERQFGRFRLFVNGENLTGVRQTRWDPLLRTTRAADGRWTVDAWAPLEGRNVNGGIRIRF